MAAEAANCWILCPANEAASRCSSSVWFDALRSLEADVICVSTQFDSAQIHHQSLTVA